MKPITCSRLLASMLSAWCFMLAWHRRIEMLVIISVYHIRAAAAATVGVSKFPGDGAKGTEHQERVPMSKYCSGIGFDARSHLALLFSAS